MQRQQQSAAHSAVTPAAGLPQEERSESRSSTPSQLSPASMLLSVSEEHTAQCGEELSAAGDGQNRLSPAFRTLEWTTTVFSTVFRMHCWGRWVVLLSKVKTVTKNKNLYIIVI